MSKTVFGMIIFTLIILPIFLGGFSTMVSAQEVADDVLARRAKLEADLAIIDREINAQKTVLEAKQKEGVSLERDVAILTAQIQKAKLSIKARDLSIAGLVDDIGAKNRTIVKYSAKINRERETLASLMRRTNELDTYSIVEVALSDKNFSEFFVDLDNFQYVEEAIGESLEAVGVAKKATEEEKKVLEGKKSEETDLRKIQELEKKRIEANEAEKRRILKETKGQEVAYQKILKEKQQSAAQIRAELFSLSGSTAISFEKALAFARAAAEKTGVRPAIILGIIAEESNLGQNVGKGTWTVDMHQTRDVPVFKYLTSLLGLNPDKMPVSKRVWYGYGGAMGPAQFIPSTWACFSGYVNTTTGKCSKNPDGSWVGPWEYQQSKDRVGKLTGNFPPNPWDPKDAFMAAGLYLSDSGADAKTSRSEFVAAMCYLAGCGNVNKKSLQFYGDDVMCLAQKYQKNIDILEGTNIAAQRAGDIYHAGC
ncbi:MAG: lytic murein transglycosylase [bacterium]|nr:lytic murein transglycosylase [bacterium]